MTIRIAMWSGPRNISTAMMRSWENRPDCTVVDEPFYAFYLTHSGKRHPMQEEVLASQDSNFDNLVKMLTEGDVSQPIQYQKHMTQHMLADVDLSWTKQLRHCFLIRDPAAIVSSFSKSMTNVSTEDIGILRQAELYTLLSEQSETLIPVISSEEVLKNPRSVLQQLCHALEVPFANEMLEWPAGKRYTDGVWAPHWYANVEKSTGFGPAIEKELRLNDWQQRIVDEVMPAYETLAKRAIKAD
ncbi:hypothetical protein [Glaciecola sp. 1036]|uniref:sulfotransferase-like domain-containing protein n=1 Tax=Alteromonadaceae TaxID=72275 RepID=UPI003CFD58A7